MSPPPAVESTLSQESMKGRLTQASANLEEALDGGVDTEESLSLGGGLEPSHLALSLSCGLMSSFGPETSSIDSCPPVETVGLCVVRSVVAQSHTEPRTSTGWPHLVKNKRPVKWAFPGLGAVLLWEQVRRPRADAPGTPLFSR